MRISCNSKQIDIPLIHRFLSEESQWAKGISLPVVEKAIKILSASPVMLGPTKWHLPESCQIMQPLPSPRYSWKSMIPMSILYPPNKNGQCVPFGRRTAVPAARCRKRYEYSND